MDPHANGHANGDGQFKPMAQTAEIGSNGEHKVVTVHFGKRIEGLYMPPDYAARFAEGLIAKALTVIAEKPLTIKVGQSVLNLKAIAGLEADTLKKADEAAAAILGAQIRPNLDQCFETDPIVPTGAWLCAKALACFWKASRGNE